MDILFIYPAESEGFEPPIRRNAYTAFRVRLFRPLRQLSEIFEKRVQRYCFFLTYANKSAFFLQKRCLFGFYLVKTRAKDTSYIRY